MLATRARFPVAGIALAAACLTGAAPAAAKEKFPLRLTVESEAKVLVAGAAVSLRALSGEPPFETSGVTDKRGRYTTNLPDFSRVYELKVSKEGFTEFSRPVDLGAQNLRPGATAELRVTLPERRGATVEEIYNEGVRAIQANDRATAILKMENAVEQAPELVEGWSVLAMLYVDAKRWPEALEAADKTLALKAADGTALIARVEALVALGRREEADGALDALAAGERTKESARVLFNAGAEAWSRKDGAVATKRFEQALAADPGLHQACGALAEVKIGARDLAGALAELDRGLAIAPTDRKLWRRKVDVLKALGRVDDAAAAEKTLSELGG